MSNPIKPKIENRDIVFIGFPWFEPIGSNCKDLALQFQKTNRILYVNFPLSYADFHSSNPSPSLKVRIEKQKGLKPELEKIENNIWLLEALSVMIPHNGIKIPWVFDLVNWFNNRAYAKHIKSAIQTLGFKNIILFSDQSIYHSFYMKELLNPEWFLYYERDYLQGVDYYKPNGIRLEPKIIKKVDIALSNSHFLKDFTAKFNPRSYYIGQGCDLHLFNPDEKYSIPSGLENIHRPIIGYVGALVSHRLDLDLLIYIAKNFPQWSLVLVGPEDSKFKSSALHGISNVYFLGNRPIEDLPSFIQNFDVCINPQIMNEITVGNYPRKIDEYLAMGKPVVALKTEAMKDFEEFTYLATDKADFAKKIQNAMDENTPEKIRARIKFADSHTWENSYQLICDAFFTEESRRNSFIKSPK